MTIAFIQTTGFLELYTSQFNSLVLKRIVQFLGLECIKIAMSGGASINVSTIEFFMGLNIPIMEMYGMSEGTVAQCLSTISDWCLGSVGRCINSVYLKINNPDEDGEGEMNRRFMY